MAGLTPLPQTVIHSSTRLTHGQAHSLLSSFLELSQTNPAYRPDAILTQHGPQSANTGEGSNLTLNHLDRILKGIEGHRVGGIEWNSGDGQRRTKRRKLDEDDDQAFRSSPPVYSSQGKHEEKEIMDVEGADGQDEAAIVGIEADDWQDKEDFEHAQADVTADLAGRDPAGEGIERHGENIEVGVAGGLTPAEKEARKLAKKQRRKEEKREKKTNDEGQETEKKKKKSKS